MRKYDFQWKFAILHSLKYVKAYVCLKLLILKMKSRTPFLLSAILLLAAILRLWALGAESIWVDEALTTGKIQRSVPELVKFFSGETQTILYYFIEKFWCDAFGNTEWIVRFPSVIYGLLAVFGCYFLGKRLFSTTVGLYSALFMAINPFAIFYSQEARPYALFLAASVLSLYYLIRVFNEDSRGASIGFVLTATVAFYSHPLALLLSGVYVTVLLFRESSPIPFRAAVSRFAQLLMACFLLYIPQAVLIWRTVVAKTEGASSASWIPVPSLQAFVGTLQQFFMFPLTASVISLIILIAGYFALRKSPFPKALWILLSLIAFTMVAPWILSHILTPLYVHRYVIPALAAFIIALAWAITTLKTPLRALCVAAVIVLTAYPLYHYYTGIDKDPWRAAARDLEAFMQPGDLIIVSPSFTRGALNYYLHTPSGVDLAAPRNPQNIPSSIDRYSRVLLVSSYDHKPSKLLLHLRNVLSAGHFMTKEVVVAKDMKKNPFAYWMSPIRIQIYVPRNFEQDQQRHHS